MDMKWHCLKFWMFLNLFSAAWFPWSSHGMTQDTSHGMTVSNTWGDIYTYVPFPKTRNDINTLAQTIRSQTEMHISLGHGLYEDAVYLSLNSTLNPAFTDRDYQNIATNILQSAPHAQYIIFDTTQLNAGQLSTNNAKIYQLEKYFLTQNNAIKFGIVVNYGTEPTTSARILELITQNPNKNSFLEIQGDWVAFINDFSRQPQMQALNQNIDFLNLSSIELDETNTQLLATYLKTTPNLRGIDLSSTMLKNFTNGNTTDANGRILRPLTNVLKTLRSISYFKLSSNAFDEESAAILADAIRQFNNLSYINISYNYIGGNGANIFLRSLTPQKQLTFIDIANNRFDAQNADDFVNILKNKASIAYIDASQNFFSTDGSNKIRVAISNVLILQSLQVFKLRKNYYVYQHFAEEVKISDNYSKLFYIDIGENYFYTNQASIQFKNDKFAPALKYLYLDGDNLRGVRFADIANEIININQLRYLDISDNNIGSEGIDSLVAVLTRSKTLTGMNLSGNSFSASDMVSVTKALTTFPQINTLILSKNHFDKEGVSILAKHFSQNRNLNELNLSNMEISNDDAIILASGLNAQMNLSVLDISFNDIDMSGLKSILKSLKNKPKFTTLLLDGNKVNCDDVTTLVRNPKFKCL